MNDVPALFAAGQQLALRIAPELADAPLYFIAAEAMDRPPPMDCLAYAGRIDTGIRAHLEATGDWQGPGRVVVFCMSQLAAGGNVNREFLTTTVHEVAHTIIMRPTPSTRRPPSALAKIYDESMYTAFARGTVKQTPINSDHGDGFIRRALHAWQRAIWAGTYVEPWQVCAGWNAYGIHDARDYLERLGDEPARLRHSTFAEIEQAPPPAAFTQLWQADLARLQEQTE